MTDQKRRELVIKIDEKIGYKRAIFERQKQLFARKRELEQHNLIKEYNQVRADISQVINIISHDIFTQPDDQIIREVFGGYFREHQNDCEHPIYIYVGSFGKKAQVYRHSEATRDVPMIVITQVNDEKHPNFSHNNYICTQCRQKIQVSDWQEFERNSNVLKSYTLQAEDYINIYFELLYYHGPEEAQRLLRERFLQDNASHSLQFKPESQ